MGFDTGYSNGGHKKGLIRSGEQPHEVPQRRGTELSLKDIKET